MKNRPLWLDATMFLLVIIDAILFIVFATGCGSIKSFKQSNRIDSVIVIKYDSTWRQKDSTGNTYTKETIREFYHRDSLVAYPQPYPIYRQIDRESGQQSLVKENEGKVAAADSTNVAKKADSSNTQAKSWGWFEYAVLGTLAFLILKPFFKITNPFL